MPVGRCEICHKRIFPWWDFTGILTFPEYQVKTEYECIKYDDVETKVLKSVKFYNNSCIAENGKTCTGVNK